MRLIANGTGSPGGREAYDDTIGSVSDPAEIRVALNKLLDDPAFQASPRNKQFLRFVVEETLAGREARIKSYTIAVDVFGRPTDFDGSIDPIVRIEASRLRTALSNYYGNPSVDPSIKIGLPKGGYIPEFSPIEPTARSAPRENIEPAVDKPPVVDKPPAADKPPAPARPEALRDRTQSLPRVLIAGSTRRSDNAGFESAPRRSSFLGRLIARILRLFRRQPAIRMPFLFVDPVEALTDDPPTVLLARGLSQSLISALGQYDSIAVSRESPDGKQAVDRLLDANPDRLAFRLSCEVRIERDAVHLWWSLSDRRTMEVYRSATEEGPWGSISGTMVEDEIAEKVAAAIAYRNGFINSSVVRAFADPPPPGYPAVLRAQHYSMTLDPNSFAAVRGALERTVSENPDYAEAWAYLAYLYTDEIRHGYDTTRSREEVVALARDAANNASRLAPYSALTYLALMVVEFVAGDDEAFAVAADRALEISPSDPKMLILAGNRFWLLGRREHGRALIQRGLDIAQAPGPMDTLILAMDDYVNGNYHEALALLQRMPDSVYSVPMLAAACYGQLGDPASAASQLRRLIELRPIFATEIHARFRHLRLDQMAADLIVEGLGKAGLPVAEDVDPGSFSDVHVARRSTDPASGEE